MKTNNASEGDARLAFVFSLVVGIFAFLLVVGPRALQPSNIAWLGDGDPATHYLGWLFFRNSKWHFPISLSPKYGLEIGNAIIFSDSNPFLAFLFKPFSQFLPEVFQYFGVWLLICFILQAWFAYKLVGLITTNPFVTALSACLFVFAPPMIWRLHGHLSLVGHFFILAALYFTLHPAPKKRIISWSVLLVIAALTHAYLLAMAGLIWGADIVGRQIRKELIVSRAFQELSVVLGATLLACWQAGYFSVGDGVSLGGYGVYRMNLLSIIDPSGWSYVLRDIPERQGDYEGFNYLGLGVILLWVCALPALLSNKIGALRSIGKRPVLLAGLLALTIFALSNKIGFASYAFEMQIPDFVMRVANTFRASGRMFWPVFYLIYFLVIFVLIRGYNTRAVVVLLGFGLVFQVVDTSKAWIDIREKLMVQPNSVWQTKMVDPFWNEAAKRYNKVRWLIPTNHSSSWQSVSYFAGTHNLATDAVYLARIGNVALDTAQEQAKAALQSGVFESDSLYLLEEGLLRHIAMSLDADNDLLAQVDGFTLVAPGWRKCTSCYKISGEIETSDYLPLPVGKGDRLLFSQNQLGSDYLASGWSHPEHWGTWSDGADAMIFLHLESEQVNEVVVEANPLLSASHPKQVVRIRVNGFDAGSVTLTANSESRFQVAIPSEVKDQLKTNRVLKLWFHFPNAARPVDIGINDDQRNLGIGLVSISIQ